jgi:hypothetical protein
MKNINRYIALAVFGGMLTFNSCETTDLDITANPNALTPDQASVDFFLSSIQEDYVREFEGDADFDPNDNWQSGGATNGDGLNLHGMELTRIGHSYGSRAYRSGYQGSDMDDEWLNAYLGILADIRAMQPLAEEAELNHHLAIAQFIEAHIMVSLVDFFGDVPYSEIVQAAEGNFSPKLDPGAEIYDAALALLNEAIANFNGSAAAEPAVDFFYGGNYTKWVNAANTLKMKIFLNRRLVDPNAITSFNSIVSSGNYIQSTADDFQYNWTGTSASQPDTRHPRFGLNYTASGAGDYTSNWLMNKLDTTDDPRLRYYYYRQTSAVPGQEIPPDEEKLTCSLQTPPAQYVSGGFTFCNLPNGYWGRDHGDDEGTPPDGLLRTTYGTYPFGGKFDDDSFKPISPTAGAGGKGVTVLLSAFDVDFMKAEVAMVQNNATAARDFMLAGFDKQMAKVQAFLIGREAGADVSFEPTAGEIATFRSTLSSEFDAASADGKWDILGEQYFIANQGNGVNTYNFYRRTNFPTTLQPNREPDPGEFVESMYYPSNAVNNNSQISQKPNQAQPVFWDTNGAPPAN